MARHSSSFFQGWEDKEHVRIFDWFSYFPTPLFIKQFEYFNEIQLLRKYFDISCNRQTCPDVQSRFVM